MEMELTGWKAIVYDIARKMEQLGLRMGVFVANADFSNKTFIKILNC